MNQAATSSRGASASGKMGSLRFTVLIDTYNHEQFIEQAITSVLEQDFPSSEMEIIVVDDGSTDRTPEIVRQFEPRVRLIRKSNGGQASAFNTAIPQAHGEIIAFLDGDDWWAKDKLSAVLDAFEENPQVAAVGHGYYEVFENNPPAEMVVAQKNCLLDLSCAEAARLAILGRSLLGTSRLAVRRRVLDRVGSLPTRLIFCADTPILTLSLALGGAVILDRPLCYYRLHRANLFADSANDETVKSERVLNVLNFLSEYLPERLLELGISQETVTTFLDLDRIEIERIEIKLHKGGRWKTFGSEMRRFKASYRNPSPSYLLFKGLVGLTALVLSPRRFSQVRDWYGRNNLKRFRNQFAKAEPAISQDFFQRRPVVGQD
jgi:glycosyltransferase involved in cell wall biosynthesis